MNPDFSAIGEQFVTCYYNGFDDINSRKNLKPFYHPTALLTFEGTQFQGPDPIIEKLVSIPSYKIERRITCKDYQPSIDGGVLITIIGQLKTEAENDQVMPFTHVFSLKPENGHFFIFNEIFRIAFHNY